MPKEDTSTAFSAFSVAGPAHPPPWKWDQVGAKLRDANGAVVLDVVDRMPVDAGTPYVRAVTELAPEVVALLSQAVPPLDLCGDPFGDQCATDPGSYPAQKYGPVCWEHRRRALLARLDEARFGGALMAAASNQPQCRPDESDDEFKRRLTAWLDAEGRKTGEAS